MTCEASSGGKLCRSEILESGPAWMGLTRRDSFRNMCEEVPLFPVMKHMLYIIIKKVPSKMFRVSLASIQMMMAAQFASLTGILMEIWTSG
tara:strand:- start:171 stop:443 length:273 start_codon:yes stop_codon:yes gene_type:complete